MSCIYFLATIATYLSVRVRKSSTRLSRGSMRPKTSTCIELQRATSFRHYHEKMRHRSQSLVMLVTAFILVTMLVIVVIIILAIDASLGFTLILISAMSNGIAVISTVPRALGLNGVGVDVGVTAMILLQQYLPLGGNPCHSNPGLCSRGGLKYSGI